MLILPMLRDVEAIFVEQVASSLDAPAWDAIYSDFQSMVEARPNNAWGYFRIGYATLGRDMNPMATIKYASGPSSCHLRDQHTLTHNHQQRWAFSRTCTPCTICLPRWLWSMIQNSTTIADQKAVWTVLPERQYCHGPEIHHPKGF